MCGFLCLPLCIHHLRLNFWDARNVVQPVQNWVNERANVLMNGLIKFITHFEITGDPCHLIGSQQCDLFTNRTIFCSKSHPFLAHQKENEIIMTNQIS